MHLKYLGDSFDIVKQSFLRWLSPWGRWCAHPMLTEPLSSSNAKVLSGLLGVRLISRQVLDADTDRNAYFTGARECASHLFLDPDTGVSLKHVARSKAPKYLLREELAAIVEARPRALTLVFDQSVARGREREQLAKKTAALKAHGLFSTAYVSHACFLFVASDRRLLDKAVRSLQRASHLPSSRFVE